MNEPFEALRHDPEYLNLPVEEVAAIAEFRRMQIYASYYLPRIKTACVKKYANEIFSEMVELVEN